jgi:hypothetical protein
MTVSIQKTEISGIPELREAPLGSINTAGLMLAQALSFGIGTMAA